MTIPAAVLEAMAKAGCSAEQIVAAIRADELQEKEKLAAKREKTRIRVQKHRARNAGNALQRDVTRYTPDPLEGPSPKPPSPKTPSPHSPPTGAHTPPSLRSGEERALKTEFDAEFWPAYPNKVGKPDALKAFLRARQRAPLDSIMAGLDAYRRKTDDRPWCNPSTFLNQDRWNDQPAPRPQAQAPPSREPTFAEFLRDKAHRMEDEEHARTIEATGNEHGNRDSAFRALYGPSTSQGKV